MFISSGLGLLASLVGSETSFKHVTFEWIASYNLVWTKSRMHCVAYSA